MLKITVANEFLQKARKVDEMIERETERDPGIGGYGICCEDWDDLLNEVCGVLADAMPSNDFERLREE